MKTENNKHINRQKDRLLLEVKHLSIAFPQFLKGFQQTQIQVISDFEMTIKPGEVVAVIGASGAGKSLLADAILGILPKTATVGGKINYRGKLLSSPRQKSLRGKEIALIPQSVKALNPLIKVGKQVRDVIPAYQNKKELQEEAFYKLGLSPEISGRFPHQLSGGMARRVLIATAMLSKARLVIADEPTPGLDECLRNEVISDISKLVNDGERSVMLITHDINAALKIADRIVVVKNGKTIETAPNEAFRKDGKELQHAYTRALWQALPENWSNVRQDLKGFKSSII